jgi:hypothetical protein
MGLISVAHASEPFDFAIPGKIDGVSINDFEDLLAEVKQQQTYDVPLCCLILKAQDFALGINRSASEFMQ